MHLHIRQFVTWALAAAKQLQELHQSLGVIACYLCLPELEKQSSELLLCL